MSYQFDGEFIENVNLQSNYGKIFHNLIIACY